MSARDVEPMTRRHLVNELMVFATPSTSMGLRLFVVDVIVYALGFSSVFFAHNLALRFFGSLLMGLKTTGLYTLAHDGSHNSLTQSRRLNKVLAVLGHLPCLMNQRLWVYDHVVMHHARTNGPQVDIYRPMSLAQYRAAPAWRKLWERWVRSSSLLFRIPSCMIGSRWLVEKFAPNPDLHPLSVRREAWPLTALLLCWLSVIFSLAILCNPGNLFGVGLDIFLALVVPMSIFHMSLGTVSYVQHTHPSIPWFALGDDSHGEFGPEALTVHVKMPKVLASLIHNGLDHSAHHVLPAIPSYHLRAAQLRLNEVLGHTAIVLPLSMRVLRDITSKCKLYDYSNHVWLDFGGRPTTNPIRLPARSLGEGWLTISGQEVCPADASLDAR
jgi:omega-6 fatty acid desaturase (delta-12 desaturase)